MAHSEFTIFKKKCIEKKVNQKTGEVKEESGFKYCARFLDENGQIVKTKTLEAKKPKGAIEEAKDLLAEGGLGILTEDPYVMNILTDFWREGSAYALAKKRKGEALSKNYTYINAHVVKKHLTKPLAGVKVSKLSVSFMDKLVEKLESEGKSPRTINGILSCLQIPLRNWSRKHSIPYPLEYFDGHSKEHPKERGTLSIEDIQKIIALQGISPRVKLGILLGCMCGLRLGEVVGIQPNDIDTEKKIVHVRHNWVNNKEGLKGPKCNSVRDVPLPSAVEEAHTLCLEVNPYDNCPFVLWNEASSKRPVDSMNLTRGYKRVLKSIGIDETERKERNLVFHGLRHTFVSLSRASGLPDFLVMRMAGHKSASMMENYSHAGNVIDFNATRAKMDATFAKVEKVANQ